VIAHLRAERCPRPLGIVAEADYDDPYFAALSPAQKRDCAAFLHFDRTRPDFLSWFVDDLPHATPALFRALGLNPRWRGRCAARAMGAGASFCGSGGIRGRTRLTLRAPLQEQARLGDGPCSS